VRLLIKLSSEGCRRIVGCGWLKNYSNGELGNETYKEESGNNFRKRYSHNIINNFINVQSTNVIQINFASFPTIANNLIRGLEQTGGIYGIYTEGTANLYNNVTSCYLGIFAAGQSTIKQNIVINNLHNGIRSDKPIQRLKTTQFQTISVE
jgi:hypothetical protein